jgi:hypothetical protein
MATTLSEREAVKADVSYGAIHTESDAATVAWDASNGNRQKVTLAGNRTFTFSGWNSGQTVLLIIKQDGTGSRTVTWPTIRWAEGDTEPTLTTTGGKEDWILIVYDGTDYVGFVVGQNV